MVVIGCVSVAVFRTLFVRLIAFLLAAAVAAAAAAPTALAACAAFALLGHGGGRGCLVGAFVLRCDEVFEIVLVFKRRGVGLCPLGQRLGRFRRVHLLTAIDDKCLPRRHRFIGRDGDGDGEALFQAAQMRAL